MSGGVDRVKLDPRRRESQGGRQSSPLGGRRIFFVWLLRDLASRRRRFSRGGTRVGTRGASTRPRSASAFRSRARARERFRCWLRSSRATTTSPVGRWVRRTALSVTFWCCPPGPPARKVSTRHWARRAGSSSGTGGGSPSPRLRAGESAGGWVGASSASGGGSSEDVMGMRTLRSLSRSIGRGGAGSGIHGLFSLPSGARPTHGGVPSGSLSASPSPPWPTGCPQPR
jgi:hypothetical protein